jgi:colicin import membrane protein
MNIVKAITDQRGAALVSHVQDTFEKYQQLHERHAAFHNSLPSELAALDAVLRKFCAAIPAMQQEAETSAEASAYFYTALLQIFPISERAVEGITAEIARLKAKTEAEAKVAAYAAAKLKAKAKLEAEARAKAEAEAKAKAEAEAEAEARAEVEAAEEVKAKAKRKRDQRITSTASTVGIIGVICGGIGGFIIGDNGGLTVIGAILGGTIGLVIGNIISFIR